MLGIAQEMDVGLGARLQVLPAAVGEALEGARRALLAEIAGDGGAQFVDGDAGAEQAEARRDGGVGLAHEDIGLDPLHRRRPAARARSRHRQRMLSVRLQTTPWVSCGRSTPNRAVGFSAAMPNGPVTTTSDQNTPSQTRLGRSSV